MNKPNLELLDKINVKYTPESVVWVVETEGKVIWLESGNSKVGLQHIVERHAGEFAGWGLTSDKEISSLILKTVNENKGISYNGGIVYEIKINNETKYLNIVAGDNGFIVTAHPIGEKEVRNLWR